ncbi:MAG: hypothetical protein KAU35_10690 [candidate division Zixibacteria bacterium]|nr:hypothetical protein [candidate division Zixibacteria bacterium]
MIRRLFILTSSLACLAVVTRADVTEADSAFLPTSTDSVPVIPVEDSTAADMSMLLDSAGAIAPPVDSLGDSSMTGISFEERYEEYRKAHLQRPPSLSYFDSLVAYFASDRLNVRPQRERSFYHDAGDYFRFDPSYFIVEHQATPLRKTVQPFGLGGDRLNFVIDRLPVHPFEHVLEPDGLVDLGDVPTAFDHDLFIIPGATGMLFGGRQAVATLMTLPREPAADEPETAIMADKGGLGYSWVRGKYSRRFKGGKNIDAAVGYRKADGLAPSRADDAYHYVGDMYFPLAQQYGLRARGQLYSRDGWLPVRPDNGGATVSRSRFDRCAVVAFDYHNNERTARYETGYEYVRQGSFTDGAIRSRFNMTGHGGFLAREWLTGRTIMKARLGGQDLQYDSWYQIHNRTIFDVTLDLARLNDGLRFAITAGGRHERDYGFLPRAAVAFNGESARLFVLASLGYSERAPSLHERYLPLRRFSVYVPGSFDYADEGNPQLSKERQLVGNFLVELGSSGNSLRLSVTGGRIFDGIDWQDRPAIDSVDIIGPYTLFSPANGDIEFADITIQKEITIRDAIRFHGGGAYHHVDYARFDDKPYQPEYQAFSGVELHYYWRQKLLGLRAYGEVVYVGPYHGYDEKNLGDGMVANAKLTLELKDFRFHFVFQNVLSRVYRSREYITFPGQFFYYGLVWNFVN